MKKTLSVLLFIICLTLFPLNTYAQESTEDSSTQSTSDETSTSADETTSSEEENDLTVTSSEDETATSEDKNATDESTTSTTGEDTTYETTSTTSTQSTTTTSKDETSSFLDNIDTTWLWVILGVGGVVLIGSIIGIISLSKKDKTSKTDSETNAILSDAENSDTNNIEQTQEIPVPTEQPEEIAQQQAERPQEDITMSSNNTTPEQEIAQSIQETLGETSTYQQPETNEQIVSNIAPQTDINKDLADLNNAVKQVNTEPEVSNIEVNSTPQQPSTQVNSETNSFSNIQATPSEIQNQTSMPDLQNQESPVTTENPTEEGFTQPINTSGL